MNGLYTGFRAALVILFVLLIPSIALAAPDNLSPTEMNDNYLKQISFSEPTALKFIVLSEGFNSTQDVQEKVSSSSFFKVLAGLAVLTT
ncbi:hypothetical protein [Sporosarcina sp. P13]|uniref:hypothetical protein n=1 Tax=Sporosarcina sp. P13 TaxID=2048263 RepID=UPI001E2F8E42|nr:hypothetical protein [Sporosarcina sp. P13]